MAEGSKALISKIIFKYPDKESIILDCNGETEYQQLDMQLLTKQLLECKYNGLNMMRPDVDFEMENVSSLEFVFKPKY